MLEPPRPAHLEQIGTNRQAFIQNRRLVVTTASRVLNDPLFSRVRFDVLIADEAPWIAAAPLLSAAGLVHERIVISGNRRDIASAGLWAHASQSVGDRTRLLDGDLTNSG